MSCLAYMQLSPLKELKDAYLLFYFAQRYFRFDGLII